LDKFATGLLIVAVGRYTKLIPYLEKTRKTYETKLLLGKTSETLDPATAIVDVDFRGPVPTQDDIQRGLDQRFSGPIDQIPPKYSALKVGGRRMSDLAREGRELEIKPRPTEIFSSEILRYTFPELEIRLEVAAGFYVRSFARDLGEMVAGAGMCAELRRTAIEQISVEGAPKLGEVAEPISAEELFTLMPDREVPWDHIRRLDET